MSKQILASKTIGVFADGKFFEGAYPSNPGEGDNAWLISAKSHFCAQEWDAICRDLGLGAISPAQAAEMFDDQECNALAWAISPKPLRCSEERANEVLTIVAPEAAYGEGGKSDQTPQGSEVANATIFKSLLGRMPQYVIATLQFKAGIAVSAKGRTYQRTSPTSTNDPTALLKTRLRFLSADAIKAAVTAAGVTIPEGTTPEGILELARAHAASVLQKLG